MEEGSPYPRGWPDGCPPGDVNPADGMYYRLVSNNPPKASDFQTNHETDTFRGRHSCLRCALSVFRDVADAEYNRSLYPKTFGNSLIAAGTLTSEHGTTKLTPGKLSSHTSWWAFRGVERHSIFGVVDSSNQEETADH